MSFRRIENGLKVHDKKINGFKNLSKKVLTMLTISALMVSILPISDQAYASSTTAVTTNNVFKVGQSYNGFVLKKSTYSEEAKSQVYQFEHTLSGGRVVVFSNKDRNKFFDMHVATPAQDNTGATHILEHTLLSGSERFPSKKAFETLNSRTVASEVNAFTGQDATDYVFNTLNMKDFNNLYEFYLDGLFAPKLLKDPKLFQREGWHYEKNAKTGAYEFNGIVFNEIKANALDSSSSDYIGTQRSLFPNTAYANDSGGVPKDIVNLAYKSVIDTYNKFYQPSNMVLLLYGDMDVNSSLKLLNDRYYKTMKKKAVSLNYGKVVKATKVNKVVGYYDIDDTGNLNKKTQLSVSYALPALTRTQEYTLMDFEYWFNNSDNDLAIECIYDKEYADDITAELNTEGKFPYLSFHFNNVDSSKVDEIQSWLQKGLEKLAYDGIDPSQLESNQSKQELMKKIYKMNPDLGSQIFRWAIIGLNVKNDPLYHLDVEYISDAVDEDVLYNRGIETALNDFVTHNKHIGVAVTLPKVGLGEAKDSELTKLAAMRVNAMKPADKKTLDAQIVTFSNWLTSAESPEIANKVPSLKISDFVYKAPAFNGVSQEQDGVKWVKHIDSTNEVAKTTFYFNIPKLTDLETKVLPLYETMMTRASTKSLNGTDLRLQIDTYTTGIQVSDSVMTLPNNAELQSYRLMMDTMTLESNMKQTASIFKGLMGDRNFKNPDFIKMLIDGAINNLEQTLLYDGSSVGLMYLNASLIPQGDYYSRYLDPEYKWFKEVQSQYDAKLPEIMEAMKSIHKKVMNKNNLVISYTGSDKGYESFKAYMDSQVSQLSTEVLQPIDKAFVVNPSSLAVKLPSKVQYVYKGFNMATLNHVPTGADYVFAKLLNDEYITHKIRLEGGAYGGNVSVNNDVMLTFSSYRDPNLKKTFDAIDNSPQWLTERAKTLTNSELDAIKIPLIASFDKAVTPFDLAMKEDIYNLCGIDMDLEALYVKQIYEAKTSDLDGFIQMLKQGLAQGGIVVMGSDESITQEQSLFKVTRSALSQ